MPDETEYDETEYDETVSGQHRVYSDGTVVRRQPDGSWPKITAPTVHVPKPDPTEALEEKAKRTALRVVIDLLGGQRTPVTILLKTILMLMLGGGSGAFASWRLFGDKPQHDRFATVEQVEELTQALNEAKATCVELHAEYKAHEDLEAHPIALYRLGALEAQLSATTNTMNELHRSQ